MATHEGHTLQGGHESSTEPMQIDSERVQPLSAQEKQRRRINGLCMYIAGSLGALLINSVQGREE